MHTGSGSAPRIVCHMLDDPEINPEIAYGGWMKMEDDGDVSTCACRKPWLDRRLPAPYVWWGLGLQTVDHLLDVCAYAKP